MPIRYKRKLVRSLTSRAKKILPADTINRSLEFIYKMLIEIGCLQGILNMYYHTAKINAEPLMVGRVLQFLKLQFDGDSASNILHETPPAALLGSLAVLSPGKGGGLDIGLETLSRRKQFS